MAWAAVMVMVTRLRRVMVQVSGWLPSAPELLTLGVAVLLLRVKPQVSLVIANEFVTT